MNELGRIIRFFFLKFDKYLFVDETCKKYLYDVTQILILNTTKYTSFLIMYKMVLFGGILG